MAKARNYVARILMVRKDNPKNITIIEKVYQGDNIGISQVEAVTNDALSEYLTTKVSCSIKSLRILGTMASSYMCDKTLQATVQHDCTVMGETAKETNEEYIPLKVWNEETKTYVDDDTYVIGVDVYEPGYVISLGKESTNMFGQRNSMYLDSINSRNIHGTTRSYAKRFKDLKSLKTHLEKYEKAYKYLVSNAGYSISYEPANEYFTENEEKAFKKASGKKQASITDIKNAITNMLSDINGVEEAADVPVKTADNPKDEAILRMMEEKIYKPYIDKFKKDGTVFISEIGGMIYDAVDHTPEAQAALEEVRNDGYLPYMIVHRNTNIGDFYTVLYVSDCKEDWAEEHIDKYGYIMGYTYNASDPELSEYGLSRIDCCNGGLQLL